MARWFTGAYSRHRRLKMLIANILVVALILSTVLFMTPYFCAMLIRAVFAPSEQSPAPDYEQITQKVTIYNDVEYPSEYGSNVMDIYIPNSMEQPFKTIIFTHGGGYVGGDKQETRSFAASLAANGYAVVSINYARAPQANYPVPLIQLSEVCEYIKTDNPYNLDATNLIFAGSSAGAHCVAQFVTIQSSREYANLTEIKQTVPAENIKAVLLYCGPYNFEAFGTQGNSFMKFMMGRSMWAYFDTYNWRDRYGFIATIKHHVTSDFPPVFITDGNTGSFEKDGKELVQTFQSLNVPVASFFSNIDDNITGHEFQYDMQTPTAKTVFAHTMEFLDTFTKH